MTKPSLNRDYWVVTTEWWLLSGYYWVVTTEWWLLTGDYWMVTTKWWPLSGDYWVVTTEWWLLSGDYWVVTTEWWPLSGDHWVVTQQGKKTIKKTPKTNKIIKNNQQWIKTIKDDNPGCAKRPRGAAGGGAMVIFDSFGSFLIVLAHFWLFLEPFWLFSGPAWDCFGPLGQISKFDCFSPWPGSVWLFLGTPGLSGARGT